MDGSGTTEVYSAQDILVNSGGSSIGLNVISTAYQKDGNWIADKALIDVSAQMYPNSDCTGTVYDTATSNASGVISLDAEVGSRV